MRKTGRRGRKAEQFAASRGPVAAREELELRWRDRLVEEPRLATMVTAAGAQREPLHRWVRYRQGFSPALVRLFLAETAIARRKRGIVLDPFSGAGTTVIECARNGIRSAGIDALASMVFLAAARWARAVPDLPPMDPAAPWQALAERLTTPIHRAALMLAVGRRHTTSGEPQSNAPPLDRVFEEVVSMIREDVGQPLAVPALVLQGDARTLDMLADRSIAAAITSPPYLSRYDYRESAGPYEVVYRHWHDSHSRPMHVQASPKTTGRQDRPFDLPPAAREACEALIADGHAALAATVRQYFGDMDAVLRACGRVLAAGGPCWLVVGGARIKDVYAPADLVVAELAVARGFDVESLRVARDLIPARRKFGRIGHISPRETVLTLRKT